MLLPDHILSKIADPAERKRMGKAGVTLAELEAEHSEKAERQDHNNYLSFLHRNEFKNWQILHANPNKRSTLPPGHPDFLIQAKGRSLYLEFKAGTNKLSDVQELVIADMIGDGFTVKVVRSYAEAVHATLEHFEL
jgi:hypothetical protein